VVQAFVKELAKAGLTGKIDSAQQRLSRFSVNVGRWWFFIPRKSATSR